jgi:hypothetical protein
MSGARPIRPGPIATLALVLWSTLPAVAQVHELADPQKCVFGAFPEADGYQAIVRDVDVAARRAIETALPFRVHFNELGAHSLYVALRGHRPLGLVYMRREESAWGLADVEWAMTLDLRVVGFRFQRARSRQPHPVESSEFGRQLIGQGRSGLAAHFDAKGHLRSGTPGVTAGDEDLAELVVRSGLKAIVVADTVWSHELVKLRERALGLQAFPTASRFERVWPREPGPADARDALPRVDLAVRAFDRSGRPVGVAAEVQVGSGGETTTLRWVVDGDAAVVAVVPVAGPADEALRAAGLQCRGTVLTVLAKSPSLLAEAAERLAAAVTEPAGERRQ